MFPTCHPCVRHQTLPALAPAIAAVTAAAVPVEAKHIGAALLVALDQDLGGVAYSAATLQMLLQQTLLQKAL